jgi:hypothetical protein
MKYLKINIVGDYKGGMVYPLKYEEEVGAYATDHLYYEEGGYAKLLLCFTDASFKSTMVRKGIEEISEADAIAISEANETRSEFIKDEAKLRRIELKVAMGETLTSDETVSTDISQPTSVFGTTKILADKIVELKGKETAKEI